MIFTSRGGKKDLINKGERSVHKLHTVIGILATVCINYQMF